MRKPRGSSKPKTEQAQQGNVKNGDVLPPPAPDGIPPALYAEIVAQINQYTDRPDLLIEAIERHDPGFIRSMNEEARDFSKKSRTSKFNFGRFQAYTSLLVQVVAAAVILYVLYIMADNNHLTVWILIGIGILFAITQSGLSGFMRIVNQISSMVSGKK